MSRDCEARQYSDQMQCGRCGLAWDMNDPEPPACQRLIDRRAIPTRRVTTADRRVEESFAAPAPAAQVEPHGCNGKPRQVAGAVTHVAQDGYALPKSPSRVPRHVEIRHVMSTECRYDKSASDPKCGGCQWRAVSP